MKKEKEILTPKAALRQEGAERIADNFNPNAQGNVRPIPVWIILLNIIVAIGIVLVAIFV